MSIVSFVEYLFELAVFEACYPSLVHCRIGPRVVRFRML
jgi:hypothetical protein